MSKFLVIAALLAAPAAAVAPKNTHGALSLSAVDSSEKVKQRRADCGKKHPVSKNLKLSFLQGAAENPGAGLGEIVPYETVLKDGFQAISCVKDYMFTYGDKNYKNKHEYNQGDVSNVSIVHYKNVVPKEDQEPMTHEVCFNFCRTIPDMLNFGILNGRECYCAPFFKPMESDSSECDATCEGDPVRMCGGKTKSSIFGMHMCANTAEDLDAVLTKSKASTSALKALYHKFDNIGVNGQKDAEEVQKIFGQAGDPVASDQMQATKVQAGVLEHLAEDADALITAMEGAQNKIKGMAKADFSLFEAAAKAEALIKDVEEQLLGAKELAANMEEVIADHFEIVPEQDAPPAPVDRKELYYPVMYFVDRQHEQEMSTCDGEMDGKPLMGLSMDECAAICDSKIHSCEAFNYFSHGKGICILFTKLTSITHYTGCKKVEGFGRFLQKTTASKKKDEPKPVISCLDGLPLREIDPSECDAAAEAMGGSIWGPTCDAVGPGEYCECDGECGCEQLNQCGGAEIYQKGGSTLFTAKCVAKFQKFNGLNLTPQGSGKCDVCLKKVNKAERCYM